MDAKIHPRRKSRMQSSRTGRDSSSDQPLMRKRGNPLRHRRHAERRLAGKLAHRPIGSADGIDVRGDLEIDKSAPPERWRAGATRKFSSLVKPEEEDSGRPGNETPGTPEGAIPGATRATITRRRKIRELGRPEERIIGDTDGPRFGATRYRSIGTAEGCGVRGDSGLIAGKAGDAEQGAT